MERIGPEPAFEAAGRARALEATGRDVIHLEIGEPDFDTPRNVSEAAARALLDDSATHYTPAAGIRSLREAMARYVGGNPVAAPLREANDFRMDPEEVASLITPRTKMIVFNSPHNPTG